MIVVCTRRPQVETTDAPEQTIAPKRAVKIIKAGTHKAVPTPTMLDTKPKRIPDSEIRSRWVKAKNESKTSAYRTAMAFFFDAPDACMQGAK